MRLSFHIAWRFLFSNKGQTLLIAMGIAIGIAVQIFIGSLIEGLQASLVDTTIGRSSHITLIAKEKNKPLPDGTDLESRVAAFSSESANSRSFSAVSPNVSNGAFLKTENSTEQVLVRGFDFTKANKIYKFDKALTEGRLPDNPNEVMLGVDLMKDFNLVRGQSVDVLTVEGKSYRAEIVGIFDFKVASVNKSWVISTLDYAREISGWSKDEITSLEIQMDQPFEADIAAKELMDSGLFDSVKIENWKEQNAQLLSGLSGQSTSSLMIQVFVLISVVLGIASVLAISVLQKSKQIGILKAMGIRDSAASWIFLFQGMILGIMGGLLGIGIGFGLLYAFTTFALKPDNTPVVPILINLKFIAASGGIAVISATLAAVFPARKSKKMSPIEVIKNG